MSEEMKTILYPVKDLARAKVVFGELLGMKPTTDQAYYVGYESGGLQIGLVPNGHAEGMTGGVAFWNVRDIEKRLRELVSAGATVTQPSTPVGGGKLVAKVSDADGNVIGLIQPA